MNKDKAKIVCKDCGKKESKDGLKLIRKIFLKKNRIKSK